MLGIMLISYLGSPIENNISRTMEEEADRIAVSLTGDAQAAISLQVNLSVKNLSELSPAGFIEWFSYSHPSVLSRIDVIERALE
jgi:STE24 endopeptidase